MGITTILGLQMKNNVKLARLHGGKNEDSVCEEVNWL